MVQMAAIRVKEFKNSSRPLNSTEAGKHLRSPHLQRGAKANWWEFQLLGELCPFRPRAGGRRSCIPPGEESITFLVVWSR